MPMLRLENGQKCGRMNIVNMWLFFSFSTSHSNIIEYRKDFLVSTFPSISFYSLERLHWMCFVLQKHVIIFPEFFLAKMISIKIINRKFWDFTINFNLLLWKNLWRKTSESSVLQKSTRWIWCNGIFYRKMSVLHKNTPKFRSFSS